MYRFEVNPQSGLINTHSFVNDTASRTDCINFMKGQKSRAIFFSSFMLLYKVLSRKLATDLRRFVFYLYLVICNVPNKLPHNNVNNFAVTQLYWYAVYFKVFVLT